MGRANFYDKVRDFLREANADAHDELGGLAIGEDDNLFDLGLITSFTAMTMIFSIEEMLGRPIDTAALDVETFYTLRSLYDRVVVGQQAYAGP